jgi:hypothetical protein
VIRQRGGRIRSASGGGLCRSRPASGNVGGDILGREAYRIAEAVRLQLAALGKRVDVPAADAKLAGDVGSGEHQPSTFA